MRTLFLVRTNLPVSHMYLEITILISDEGSNFKSLQVMEHFVHKTLLWLYENWGGFHNDCIITTTTESVQTTSSDETSTQPNNGTNFPVNANYLTAACILVGMHIFTLTVWVHLKI